MSAQRQRTELLVENLANSDTTRTPEGGPYRRKDAVFASDPSAAQFSSMFESEMSRRQFGRARCRKWSPIQRDPEKRYLPGHPDADKDGYVAYPAHESGRGYGRSAGRVARLSGQRLGDLRGQRHDSTIAGSVQVEPRHVAEHSSQFHPLSQINTDVRRSRRSATAGSSFKDILSSAISEVEGARSDAAKSVRAISFRRRRRSALHDSGHAARRPGISNVHAGAQQSGFRVSGNHEDADVSPPDRIRSWNNSNDLLATLSTSQRWTILIAAVLISAGLYSLVHWQTESGFRPLYTTLAPEDAAVVVQKLKEGSTPYRLSNNGTTVSVPEDKVAELRLEMAGAGVPKSGRIGFEIFDKTNFGMTDFAEHVNYRRALEGELERSVMAIARGGAGARAHLVSAGIGLQRSAAAGEGQRADQDPRRRSSARDRHSRDHASGRERRRRAGSGIRLGAGHARQSAESRRSAPVATQRRFIGRRARIPPQSGAGSDRQAGFHAGAAGGRGPVSRRGLRGMRSDQRRAERREFRSDPLRHGEFAEDRRHFHSDSRHRQGIPGTASNLPDAAPRPPVTGGGTSRKTENINYQTSRTVKRTVLPQGAIKRLSVSVLIDHEVHWEGTGANAKRVLVPPSPERMKVIHDLVAAAAGFNTERGDQLIRREPAVRIHSESGSAADRGCRQRARIRSS